MFIIGLTLVLCFGCKKKDENNNGNNDNINQPIPTIGVIFNSNISYGTVTDIDGNVYKTVTIDTITWMAENLKTTRYRNGDQIPNITENNSWYNLTSGAYCDYNNDINISKTYGRLYNYYAITDSRNIAPAGWHVATYNEWSSLIHFACSSDLKETGTTHWLSNEWGNNNTGFTALPGGGRSTYQGSTSYDNIGDYGCWWVIYNPVYPTVFEIVSYSDQESHSISHSTTGSSVRCVKD